MKTEKMTPKERVIEQIKANLPESLKNNKELLAVLDKVATTTARAAAKIEVVKDKAGNVKFVKDTLSGLWFPIEAFPKAKTSVGVRPQHKELLNHRNKFMNAIKKQIVSIQEKALDGEIDIQTAKKQIETLKAKEWNVEAAIKELGLDKEGKKEKPAV